MGLSVFATQTCGVPQTGVHVVVAERKEKGQAVPHTFRKA